MKWVAGMSIEVTLVESETIYKPELKAPKWYDLKVESLQ